MVRRDRKVRLDCRDSTGFKAKKETRDRMEKPGCRDHRE